MKIIDFKCNYESRQLLADTSDILFSWNYMGSDTCFKELNFILLDAGDNVIWKSKKYNLPVKEVYYGGGKLTAASRYNVRIELLLKNGDMEESYFIFETAPDFPKSVEAKWIWLHNRYVRPYKVEPYYTGYSSPQFFKGFEIKGKLRRAVAYVSALGAYEININGQRMDDSYFNPGWTDYNKRLTYQAYDITQLLCSGDNRITAYLGDSWYRGFIIFHDRNYGDIPLKLLFQLHVEYEDGRSEIIVSDESWKAGTGPIVYSDYQLGERFEPVECEDDKFYCYPVESDYDEILNKRLVPQLGPPVRVHEMMDVSVVTWLDNNTVVLNTHQNISGFLECELYGLSKGDCITFSYGEMLNADQSVYTENLRLVRQKDYYIALGRDGEIFRPHFTSHGFQYIQISGISREIFQRSVWKAIALSAGCERTGYFSCGNEKVNKLYANLYWGQVDNFSAIPTDCPQRNERLGWTGDAQIFCASACYNMDCHTYYQKYCVDMADSQFESGSIGDVIPLLYGPDGIPYFENGNGAWADAVIIIPWKLYLFYGDIGFLKKYYTIMKRFVDFLIENASDHIYRRADYGDWLNVNDDTPKEIVASAFACYDLSLMGKISEVIGKKEDASYYREQFRLFKAAFNQEFVNDDYTIYGDTQTDYLLMLNFNLAADENAETEFARHLVRRIRENNNHLSAGFVGISYLMPILCRYGYAKMAYDLLLTESYPSWLYSVVNGATTIWERWNSYTIDEGFGDVSMNSFNHYSLGSIGEWMYSGCGGILPDEGTPGFKKIHIRPYADIRLGYCRVSYKSCVGVIESRWEYKGNEIIYEFTIPVNVEAYIYLSHVVSVNGAEFCKIENGTGVYHAESGKITFIVQHKT